MNPHVKCGLDNLSMAHGLLSGKRVGLMTHPCGYDSNLQSGIDILHSAYKLTSLFACEHGIRGTAQAGGHVDNETDPETGLNVYSLYGKTRMPTPDMLSDVDVMVIDLQDVGSRFYTYLYSMANVMIACAGTGKSVIVLDRVNPIGGTCVQGTLLDEAFHSFVGEYAVPTRYALTIGEFALFVKDHLKLDVDLTVVPLTGWKRDMLWRDTGCIWTPPSPNMPSPTTALAYPGTCIFEGTNLSEGRGTTTPFEIVGAPFIDGAKLEARMRRLKLENVGFLRAGFVPTFSKWAGEMCEGVRMYPLSGDADMFAAGLFLLETILDMYPNDAKFLGEDAGALAGVNLLLGTSDFRTGKKDARTLIEAHRPLIREFEKQKRMYHIYH